MAKALTQQQRTSVEAVLSRLDLRAAFSVGAQRKAC
jgi:hypothetical protein